MDCLEEHMYKYTLKAFLQFSLYQRVMSAMYLSGLTYCVCKTTEKGNPLAQIVNERWLLF